jgi:hypothetical protein
MKSPPPEHPRWIRALEIISWPTAFVLAAQILASSLNKLTISAIPVRLEGGVMVEDIRVPVRVHAEDALPVRGAVELANEQPLQVEARSVTMNNPVTVSVPGKVDVHTPKPIPVLASTPVHVKAESPIPVKAGDPIPVSTGGPVSATVDVRSVLAPLRIDPTSSIQVNGDLEIEKIHNPIRANIRGFLFPFQ